MKQHKEAHKF